MAVWAGQVVGEIGTQCRVLRSDERAGEPLQAFGTSVINDTAGNPQHWIIDNRSLSSHLPLVDLARLVNLARTYPDRFKNVSLAWVSRLPLSGCLKAMLRELPFEFQEFDRMPDARAWLVAQPS
jgi:hypothetical protein